MTLTDRERDYLAVALSNYGDVQSHVSGRVDELLDLALKLGIHPVYLSKGLRKQQEAREKAGTATEFLSAGTAVEEMPIRSAGKRSDRVPNAEEVSA